MIYTDFVESESREYHRNIELIGSRMGFVERLAELFRDPIGKTRTDEKSDPSVFITWWLAKLTLNSLFNSFQNLLRSQASQNLTCIRYGIEVTLKAYVFQAKPETALDFLHNKTGFKNISRAIKVHCRPTIREQELIDSLFRAYGDCSAFGSHPGLDGIIFRRFLQSEIDENKPMHYQYFQRPDSQHMLFQDFFSCLTIYSLCLEFYKPFFLLHTWFRLSKWDRKAQRLTDDINRDVKLLGLNDHLTSNN